MNKSDKLFLAATFLSFALSVYLWFVGQKDEGLFVGLWVPSILASAVFVKLLNRKTLRKS